MEGDKSKMYCKIIYVLEMLSFFDVKYLNDQQLAGFTNYKYSCIDNSPVSIYISHPFWNWIVEVC
jgi:ethanolaminephosphotransferase